MNVHVEFCLIPIGTEVSLSPYVAQCHRILSEAGLTVELHANGTNLEGPWDAVFEAIKRCHQKLHAGGVPRIASSIRVGTRIDREQKMADKTASVHAKLDV